MSMHYWQLMKVNSFGKAEAQLLTPVQTWFKQQFADVTDPASLPHALIQKELVGYWHSDATDAELAGLSLRCYSSHYIHQACIRLAQQFGAFYGFTVEDLLPFVLDDRGQISPPKPPFSVTVLESFDPEKARLSTWAARLTKNHDGLNRYLLIVHGLYRVSDWAILNDTSADQLITILGNYHRCTETEVMAAQGLLQCYHQVYRQARLERRKAGGTTGRCLPPSLEQLQHIGRLGSLTRTSQQILEELMELARLLRIYRIDVRGGNPAVFRQPSMLANHVIDIDSMADGQPVTETTDADEFLQTYRSHLSQCLGGAIHTVVKSRLRKVQKRSPIKGQAYMEGLRLFHCEAKRMKAIASLLTAQFAPEVVLNSQTQVTRLLELKSLRDSVRNQMIGALRQRVHGEAIAHLTVEQLHQMADALDTILLEDVNQLIAEAETEAYSPVQGASKSFFSHQLCQMIEQFLTVGQDHE